MTDVKICGLTTRETLNASIDAGARYVGFVFYSASPRNISVEQASALANNLHPSVRRVGLFVDPSDKELKEILDSVEIDIVQLHGDESPQRIKAIKDKFQKPVMKAIRVASKYDLEELEEYEAASDWILFDAKPDDTDLPGGTGQTFDWNILKGRTFTKPWMLSGGLNHENVKDALSILNPKAVDISSGVESARGVKDIEKIKEFINVVKNV